MQRRLLASLAVLVALSACATPPAANQAGSVSAGTQTAAPKRITAAVASFAQQIASIDVVAGGAPVVLDLGTGADSLDAGLLARTDRLCVVAGARASQLQALFCAIPLVRDLPCPVGLVVVGAAEQDAALIAKRATLLLLGAIPCDPYLAEDQFATRAPTLRAIDALIRRLA